MNNLVQYLKNPNIQAFLAVIRMGEGTSDIRGYQRLYGGSNFDSFNAHPNKPITAKLGGKSITSTAAGAYQFLYKTWQGLVKQYGFTDFSPDTQDQGAVGLIIGRKALDDLIAGNVVAAIRKCNKEWASLPESPYGQPVMTMEKAVKKFIQAGGTISSKEKDMFPFIAAALPSLIQAAPDLIRIFGDSPVAERNAKAAEKVVEIAKEVTNSTSSEEAVTKIETDPDMAEAFRAQARQDFLEIEAMADKRVAAARVFNTQEEPVIKASWGTVKFVHIISLLVVLAALTAIGYVLVVSTDSTERSMALQTLLLSGFGGVMLYWLGSSNGSDKKTDLMKKEADNRGE